MRAAIVYSLVDSCKALGVNPREWMEDILPRIPGNEDNLEALRELLPDKWAKQTNYDQLDPTLANLNKLPPTWDQKYKSSLIGCLHSSGSKEGKIPESSQGIIISTPQMELQSLET